MSDAAQVPDDQFEPGLITYNRIVDAQADRSYVDSGIILDHLTDTAPWIFSLLYGDGGALSIPLEIMFYDGLKGATATVFRRHKLSGRIIPCQLSQDDPRFKNADGGNLSWVDVIQRVVPPRFDPVLTPTIMALLNQEQMISFSIGVLKVIRLQLLNPVLWGWSAAGEAAEGAAARTALRLAPRGAAITVDATAVGGRFASEVSALRVGQFQKFLEAVRRLSMMRGVSPQVKADAVEVIAKQLGLEVGGQSIASGGRILIAAKDARTVLQVAADGTIMFGRARIVGATIEIVNPMAIRPLVP